MEEDERRMTRIMQRLEEMDKKMDKGFDALEARLKELGMWDEQRR